MFKSIRDNIGLSVLKRKLKRLERNRNMLNWKDVKTIGIVTSYDFDLYYKAVQVFIAKNKDKRITIIRHADLDAPSNKEIEFIEYSEQDLNWYFKPIHSGIQQFMKQDIDVLLFHNPKVDNSLLWIYELSMAKIKIGLRVDNWFTDPDLMFEAENSNNPISTLLKETEFYLNQINK